MFPWLSWTIAIESSLRQVTRTLTAAASLGTLGGCALFIELLRASMNGGQFAGFSLLVFLRSWNAEARTTWSLFPRTLVQRGIAGLEGVHAVAVVGAPLADS